MPAPSDLVHETSSSTGTGNFTLANVNGKRSFNTAFGTGGTDLFDYFIMNRDAAEWERGTGHLSAASTLVRDTVLASSNAGAAVNFSAGTKDVVNDIPAAKQVYTDGSQTLTNKTLTSPIINTAVTGTAIATQAQQETGTATDVLVTPGRQHYHKSAPKCHAIFNGTGTPAFIAGNSNFNAASITDTATGAWDVNFTTALSAAAMCVVGCGDGRDAFLFFTRGDELATTHVYAAAMNGSFTLTDCQYMHVVVYGDHS